MNIKKTALTKKQFTSRNRRSFLVAGLTSLAALFGLDKIINSVDNDGIPNQLRKGFELNEGLWRRLYSQNNENSATAAPAPGTAARINGDIDLQKPVELQAWRLRYESPTLTKVFTLNDLEKFRRTQSAAEFRCVEGWSMPIAYEGIRFADFLAAVDPASLKLPYVGLETPDAGYYVSVDMESMLHAQTLLADQMNGQKLGPDHGEPLRLIIPLKYGIKNLKRIGKIIVAHEKPRDYWAENGYDWYSGL